jgi:hypothetical protein
VEGLHHRGAVIGGFLGLISSVGLTIVSPSVWEATLGNPAGSALFPYTSPALFSMTIGFVGIWLFSITDKQRQRREASAPPSRRSRCVRKRAWAPLGPLDIDAPLWRMRRPPPRIVARCGGDNPPGLAPGFFIGFATGAV